MLITVSPGTPVLDFSFSVPDLGAAHTMGYRAVIGYLPWKADVPEGGCLDHALVDALERLGFGWSGVWEVEAARPLRGEALGYSDGQTASLSALGLGADHGSVVYWACDFDADPVSVGGYAQGFARSTVEAGFLPGCYGSRRVVDYIVGTGMARVGWQAEAWSNGQVSQFASTLQRADYKPIALTDHNDTLLPTTYTASPDHVDLQHATWATPGDDDLTDDQDKMLKAIAARVTQLGGPYDVSLYAEGNLWKTNTADSPPPEGGVALTPSVPASVGWGAEAATATRALISEVAALRAEVAAAKVNFEPQVNTGQPGQTDNVALAEAILQAVKSRL